MGGGVFEAFRAASTAGGHRACSESPGDQLNVFNSARDRMIATSSCMPPALHGRFSAPTTTTPLAPTWPWTEEHPPTIRTSFPCARPASDGEPVTRCDKTAGQGIYGAFETAQAGLRRYRRSSQMVAVARSVADVSGGGVSCARCPIPPHARQCRVARATFPPAARCATLPSGRRVRRWPDRLGPWPARGGCRAMVAVTARR